MTATTNHAVLIADGELGAEQRPDTDWCWWCEQPRPAVATRLLEAEQRDRKGNITRPARRAPVCADHAGIFDRAARVIALIDQRRRLERRRRHAHANTRHIDSVLRAVAAQLRELGWVET
jgi:hypothetical protein